MLADELERFAPDVVVLTFPFFGPFLAAARRCDALVVVDLSDVRQSIAKDQWTSRGRIADRARGLADWLAFRRMEREAGGAADQVWLASEVEADAFDRFRLAASTKVIPNVLQLEQYAKCWGLTRKERCFGFVGSLDYQPNIRAAARLITHILPMIRERVPDARLMLIGRAPSDMLINLASGTEGVELMPNVSDPMRLLAEAGILVAPIEVGGGTKLKILEAAASGIPIVTTPKGIEGIPFRAGLDFLLTETDSDIVEAVLMLWADPALQLRLAAASLAQVRARFTQPTADAAVRRAIIPMKRRAVRNAG
jgi:glycosyltransferase involved in cell wall biosynthesis